ncbi:MAG TPA: NAD-dependent succinate-semialdehyde dehydrogenase [Stellaceae bacterium]|jgi:succinate-semialdehyde dehydrogenase / glutarate-semialdehyde dehydrogenase|nr:NAD-dependent succinate-semialdehyde dehydrogenase [Stellaceae bacterium]
MYANLALYIDGEWISGGGRESEPVINPATEKPLAALTHASKADLDRALAAAERGYKVWRATAPYERARIMRKAADIIRERLEPIARILTMEQGKVFAEARVEVAVSADIIEWYAEEGKRTYGRIIPGRVAGVRQMTVQEPVGVCAAFTPWNFPGVTPARKIGGALGAGCSLIIKASEETPGTCVELVRAFHEAGLPKGVLNLVFGVPARISEHIIASDIVRKVSFTGSVPVGKHLTKLAAEGMKRTTMELGGHSPVIVFGDADPEKSAEIAAAGKFRNAGQVCISPTRFYVQENNYDRFVKRFADYAKGLKLGDGLVDGTSMGPLANPRRLDAMEGFVADAKKRGAEILAGGARHGNQGFFFAPTVVTNIPDDSRLMTEEPFGPVAPITPFKTFDEVVARANALPFGLAAYTFTSSTRTANLISDALESGMVGVNSLAISTPETPFGGMKESGYGHEGGIEGLEAYTQKKLVVQA